jgi:hypothetical protein
VANKFERIRKSLRERGMGKKKAKRVAARILVAEAAPTERLPSGLLRNKTAGPKIRERMASSRALESE